jgi:hypothetical protein
LEPDEATKTWLHLPFESREGLQLRLHTWSRCNLHCLAGLRLEPLVEPEPEPSQTGPEYHCIEKLRACLGGLRLHQKRLRLRLLWWSDFFDGVGAVLKNVWQNGFTGWIENVKCLICPYFFSLLFPFSYVFMFGTQEGYETLEVNNYLANLLRMDV